MKTKKFLSLALSGALLLSAFSQTALAHGVWFANRLDSIQLVLGEGPEDNAYDPKLVTLVQGYDADYKKTDVEKIDNKNCISINPSEKTAVVAANFDYGYWSVDADGNWKNVPKTELKNAKSGMYALKYTVSYLGSVAKPKAVANQAYQIVPQSDPSKLKAGDKLKIQVLQGSKAMAGVVVIPDVVNHLTQTVKTDAKGMATITVSNDGLNVIGAEFEAAYTKKDKKADKTKIFVSLSFTIYPEE